MRKLNLMLHTGAAAVERGQLATVNTPAATNTWTPIPHNLFLSGIMDSLTANHMTVVNESPRGDSTHDGGWTDAGNSVPFATNVWPQ